MYTIFSFADGTRTIRFYPVSRISGNNLQAPETLSVVTSPTAVDSTSPGQIVNNVMASPGTSKPKARVNGHKNTAMSNKSLMNPTNFNALNPSADLKLPAEIFASDDSVSDAGLTATDDITAQNVLQDTILSAELCEPAKDKMLGTGIAIKMEKSADTSKTAKKSKKATKTNNLNLNLADIKTELQDDLDWSNMTLATVNNNTNVNRFQTRYG